jgi:hypothetical protein
MKIRKVYNLISLIMAFVFTFENPGVCLTDTLRKPLTTKYEKERIAYRPNIKEDVEKILPELAEGSVNQKIAYCIIVKSRLNENPLFLNQVLTWFNDPKMPVNLRKAALINLLSLSAVDNDIKQELLNNLSKEDDYNLLAGIINGLSPLAGSDNDIKQALLNYFTKEDDYNLLPVIINGLLPFAKSDNDIKQALISRLAEEKDYNTLLAIVRGLSPLLQQPTMT